VSYKKQMMRIPRSPRVASLVLILVITGISCKGPVREDFHEAGLITDALSHRPLKGVLVQETTSRQSAVTDSHGFVSMTIPLAKLHGYAHFVIVKAGYTGQDLGEQVLTPTRFNPYVYGNFFMELMVNGRPANSSNGCQHGCGIGGAQKIMGYQELLSMYTRNRETIDTTGYIQ